MTSSLTKAHRQGGAGFTLLEMLVVVLLVSLLASLLMQGFIYTSGVYKSVERRQALAQREELLNGWLRDSIHGLINGADGEIAQKVYFSGNQDSFSGLSLGALSGRFPGLPVVITWSIERTANTSALIYSEAPLYGGNAERYVIREWPDSKMAISWQYMQDGGWQQSFPAKTSVFKRDDKNLLPRAIALHVSSLATPFEIIISVRSSPLRYAPPVIEGVM
ncbi:MAG: prepilin-type N-terminal cleavage/methylation domain-containing protein [Cellvibrio sp.]|uniref:prepilin-type N-terminal cleavage/methylation domain-containing protein n=1 Tax=Cellvibrio sp. TaxID=1965322 RepID=UPI00319FD808